MSPLYKRKYLKSGVFYRCFLFDEDDISTIFGINPNITIDYLNTWQNRFKINRYLEIFLRVSLLITIPVV